MRKPVQYRSASAAAKQAQPTERRPAEPLPAQPPQVSFANDIVPIFKPYQDPMMWRFDLTSYDAVKANAATIYGRIASKQGPMPPPPYPPLTKEQIETFGAWMKAGFPP